MTSIAPSEIQFPGSIRRTVPDAPMTTWLPLDPPPDLPPAPVLDGPWNDSWLSPSERKAAR